MEQESRRWSSDCSSPAFCCHADKRGTYRTKDTILEILAVRAESHTDQPYG